MIFVSLAPGTATAATSIDYGLSAQQMTNLCDRVLRTNQEKMEMILARPAQRATFANTIVPLENLSSDVNDALVAVLFLGSVSGDRSVRSVSGTCQDESSEFSSELSSRPELAKQLAMIVSKEGRLSPVDAKLLELWNVAVRRSGATLSRADYAEVRTLRRRIDELETAFTANLANETVTIELRPEQLVGVSADLLVAWPHTPLGNVMVPVDESTEDRFLSNASDSGAREAYFRSYMNRGYPQNLPLLREVLALRLRLAHLLGWGSWAEYILADRMAKNSQRVQRFLDDLDARLLPAARTDLEQLATLKAADLHLGAATVEPWDVAYYNERDVQTRYGIDASVVRRYFPSEHTIKAVFGIYAKLLGLRFVAVVPAHAWNADVAEYEVYDAATKTFRGTLYLDLYPRPGKYTHFANFPLLPARRMPNGELRAPVDAIVGNWSHGAPGQPTLLSHEEVETFFHEFGHAMAAIVATAPYETLSNGFRTDFVEAPSQMLENWVWEPQILRKLSSNVDTGLPMPESLIQKLIATRYVHKAFFMTRQILYADVDLAYHSADPDVDPSRRWRVIARRVSPLPMMSGMHPEAAFSHIMDGYDAGYYGYLWSQVYAQDLFTAFRAGGVESPSVGARYRCAILEPAREREPDEEVRQFLGRSMNPYAFYQDLKLTIKTPL